MQFLYKQSHTTFRELLADSMLAKEFILHNAEQTKVVACKPCTPVAENLTLEMGTIQDQLEVINQYLR